MVMKTLAALFFHMFVTRNVYSQICAAPALLRAAPVRPLYTIPLGVPKIKVVAPVCAPTCALALPACGYNAVLAAPRYALAKPLACALRPTCAFATATPCACAAPALIRAAPCVCKNRITALVTPPFI